MEPKNEMNQSADDRRYIDEPPVVVGEHERLAELLIDAEQRLAEVPELKLRIADLEFELDTGASRSSRGA